MIRLRIESGPHKGEEFKFKEGEIITIGRRKSNKVALLKDDYVSREHGRIEMRAGKSVYCNLSTHGSKIKRKGKVISLKEGVIFEEVLEDGDEIVLGKDTIISVEFFEPKEEIVFEEDKSEFTTLVAKSEEEIRKITKKVQTDNELLISIYKLTKEIEGIRNLEELLDNVCSSLIKIFEDATSSIVILIDRDTHQFIKIAGKSKIKKEEIKISRSIIKSVIDQRKAVIFNNVVEIFPKVESIITAGIRSAICAPLWAKEKIIGVIQVDNRIKSNCFKERDLELLIVLSYQISLTIENAIAYEERRKFLDSIIHCLIYSLDLKDPMTSNHCFNVQMYSMGIADELNLTAEQKEILKYASLLHDFGKIAVEDAIIMKKGPLTDEERKKVQEHADYTQGILDRIYFPQELKDIPYVAGHHHERPDGKGYPDRLDNDKIPLLSKIIAVADVFDAVRSARPYHETNPIRKGVRVLIEGRGTQFDEKVVDAFIKRFNLEGFI